MKSLPVRTFLTSIAWVSIAFFGAAVADDDGLIAHWQLTADGRDSSGSDHHAINHGVTFDADRGAAFDGIDAWLEVPADRGCPSLLLFSVSAKQIADELTSLFQTNRHAALIEGPFPDLDLRFRQICELE